MRSLPASALPSPPTITRWEPMSPRRSGQAFGTHAESLLFSIQDDQPEPGVKFDLWEANRLILEQEGVKQVELSGLCTACHTEDWYSHRAENGRTGRFGAMIALPK